MTKPLIIIGTAHRMREPGKQSPDGRLKECVYSRERCSEIAEKLQAKGYNCVTDYTPLDLPRNMWDANSKRERNKELAMRVNYVNEQCRQYGAANVLYVSVHCNAAGADGKWHDAGGWCVMVSNVASEKSKILAGCLFDVARSSGIKTRQPLPTQKYWPQSLYVLNNTKCPAILTENLFQDNKEDVAYLLSDKGKQNIVDIHVLGIIDYIKKIFK